MRFSSRLLAVAALAALAMAPAWARQTVFVSVMPQKQLVEAVGGDKVTVTALVSTGKDPHTFEPTPSQVAGLARANVLFAIGMPFEKGLLARVAAGNPALRIVDNKAGIKLRLSDAVLELPGEAGHDHEHRAGEPDPHVWTSPPLMKQMAAQIRDTLAALEPASKAEFERNYQRLAAELDQLDQSIRTTLQAGQVKRFMVFHPAWGYFADTYGLQQIPIEYEGKEPGAKTVSRIIQLARQNRIPAIFVQPQFSRRAAENIAHAVGARVLTMDDLAPDMIANLKRVTADLASNQP